MHRRLLSFPKRSASLTGAARGRRQVTSHQLLKEKEKAAAAAAEEARVAELAKKREVTEASYGALVEGSNPNREEGAVEARSVEAAISALAIGPDTPEDRNPEKCARTPPVCLVAGPRMHFFVCVLQGTHSLTWVYLCLFCLSTVRHYRPGCACSRSESRDKL